MKQLLISAEVLCSYNPELPLILACDASRFGVGPSFTRRIGTTHRLLFKVFVVRDEKLFPARQGSARDSVWSKAVPLVPVWPVVSSHHRPQTITGSSRTEDRNSAGCSGPYAALGLDSVGLRLQT